MKKYAVFTKTEFVPTHELSLSNKIIEKEDVLTVLDIIRNWVQSNVRFRLGFFKKTYETHEVK